jgi:hypothetical protein
MVGPIGGRARAKLKNMNFRWMSSFFGHTESEISLIQTKINDVKSEK